MTRNARLAAAPRARRAQARLRCRRGFTLIEVLAAIVLLAITFAVGLGSLGKAAQNVGRSLELETATQRAQSLLDEQGLASPLRNANLAGRYDDGMQWTLQIRRLPRPASALGATPAAGGVAGITQQIDVFQLDVTLQYGAGRSLRLATQRAQAAAGEQP